MNDTSTRILGDPCGSKDLEAAIGSSFREKVKEGLVALSNEGLSFKLFKNGMTTLN